MAVNAVLRGLAHMRRKASMALERAPANARMLCIVAIMSYPAFTYGSHRVVLHSTHPDGMLVGKNHRTFASIRSHLIHDSGMQARHRVGNPSHVPKMRYNLIADRNVFDVFDGAV